MIKTIDLIGDPYCTHSDVNIDLWPPESWDYSEVLSFEQIFRDAGIEKVSGQISWDTRGIELQATITFVAAAIAAGFFEQAQTFT